MGRFRAFSLPGLKVKILRHDGSVQEEITVPRKIMLMDPNNIIILQSIVKDISWRQGAHQRAAKFDKCLTIVAAGLALLLCFIKLLNWRIDNKGYILKADVQLGNEILEICGAESVQTSKKCQV